MKQRRITSIGAVAIDIKGQSFNSLMRHTDTPGQVRVTIGGVARNLAKNLALLGAESSLVSVIGDDEFGRMIREDLFQASVNIDNLILIRGQRTATWVGILNAHGDLEMGVFGGTLLDTLTPAMVQMRSTTFTNADLIAVDATMPRVTIDAVVTIAQAAGVPMYLNPASVARAHAVTDCVDKFTIVSANVLEAEVLIGQTIHTLDDAKSAAQLLIQRGVQCTIVTLGAGGIVYADANGTRHLPALPTQVVDTTGAGDALAAMFLMCHLRRQSLDETLYLALRAAALTASCDESVNDDIATLR